jgi:hypothetical protein
MAEEVAAQDVAAAGSKTDEVAADPYKKKLSALKRKYADLEKDNFELSVCLVKAKDKISRSLAERR